MASLPDVALESAYDRFLAQNLDKELLRFTTAGSVDDGKSTLIGRLLHDSKNIYETSWPRCEKAASTVRADLSIFRC